jgi:hypothetical protein
VSTIEQQATGTDQHTEPDLSAAVEADPAMFCMLTRITRRIKDWWTDRLMIKTGSHSHALSHTRPAGPPKPLVRWDFAIGRCPKHAAVRQGHRLSEQPSQRHVRTI